jgi:hypothetical protein
MKSIFSRSISAGLLVTACALALGLMISSTVTNAASPKADGDKGKSETYQLLVFSNPVAGREDEYNKWYDGQHLADVVSIPGFVNGQRFVATDTQLRKGGAMPPKKYVVVYTIVTDALPAVYAEVNRRIATGITYMSPAYDRAASYNYTYKAITPILVHKGHETSVAKGEVRDYLQLVFSSPVAGKEDEYLKWYQGQHEPDMVEVPGFASGQMLALSDVQINPDGPKSKYQYLVTYKMVTDDLGGMIATYRRLSPTMVMSPAFGPSDGYTYKAVGPALSGDKVRADRAKKK